MSSVPDDAGVRERVITAADRLYYSRGIQSVGMDDLRLAAGVSLKAIYAAFPAKSAIVLAVLDRRHRLWTDGVSARVDAVDDPRGKLLAIYDYLADWFSDDTFRGCGFINAFGELGSVSPAVADLAREHKESFQAYVAGLAAAAGANESLAPQLSILAEGAQTTAAIARTSDAAYQARAAAEILISAAVGTAVGGAEVGGAETEGHQK